MLKCHVNIININVTLMTALSFKFTGINSKRLLACFFPFLKIKKKIAPFIAPLFIDSFDLTT